MDPSDRIHSRVKALEALEALAAKWKSYSERFMNRTRRFNHLINGSTTSENQPSHGSTDSSTVSEEISSTYNKINDSVTLLHMPRSAEVDLDIVFFHGLETEEMTDPHISTWKSRTSDEEVWPAKWLSHDFPKARILTVSYDSSVDRTSGSQDTYMVAENLLQDLLLADVGKGFPLILIGHSLGGLVIKRLCLTAHKSIHRQSDRPDTETLARKKFLQSIKGVFFIATPHRGRSFVDVLGKRIMDKGELLHFAEVFSRDLARLNEDFHHLCYDNYHWHVAGLGETLPTQLGKEFCGIVVDEASARCENFLAVREDHISICQPESRESTTYLYLCDVIRQVQQQLTREPSNYSLSTFGSSDTYVTSYTQARDHVIHALNKTYPVKKVNDNSFFELATPQSANGDLEILLIHSLGLMTKYSSLQVLKTGVTRALLKYIGILASRLDVKRISQILQVFRLPKEIQINTEDILDSSKYSSFSSMSISSSTSDKVASTVRQVGGKVGSIAEGPTAAVPHLQLPALRPYVRAKGLTNFREAFTTEKLLFGFSFKQDLVSDYFEVYFFHMEGMAYLVGVGLPYSLVRVRPNNIVEIEEVGQESWMEFWMEGSCSRYPHTLYMLNVTTVARSHRYRSVQLSPTEAAKQFGVGVEGSRLFVDGVTPHQQTFSNRKQYVLYDFLLDRHRMRNTKPGHISAHGSMSLVTMKQDGELTDGETSGESSYQGTKSTLATPHTRNSDNTGSTSSGGEEENIPDSQKEPDVLAGDERRIQDDLQHSLQQLTVKIFLDPESCTYESSDSSDSFRFKLEKVDEDTVRLVRPDSVSRSNSSDSHDLEDSVRVPHPDSTSGIRRGRDISYSRGKVEYVMRESQMVPKVTIQFLYTHHKHGPGRKELKTTLEVDYLLDGSRGCRSSTEYVKKFGWFHDQLKVSFKCQNSNAVRREKKDVSEEYIGSLVPGKWDRVGASEHIVSDLRGTGHQMKGSLGYKPIGTVELSGLTKKELTVGRNEKIERSDSISVNCMRGRSFAVSNIEKKSCEMAYLAQIFPPADLFDFLSPHAQDLAVASGMMSSVSMAFQGKWAIWSSRETEQENTEGVFCSYMFCCQRDLEERKLIHIPLVRVKPRGKVEKFKSFFRDPKVPILEETLEQNLREVHTVINQKLQKELKINHSFYHMHMQEFEQECELEWDIPSGQACPVYKILRESC